MSTTAQLSLVAISLNSVAHRLVQQLQAQRSLPRTARCAQPKTGFSIKLSQHHSRHVIDQAVERGPPLSFESHGNGHRPARLGQPGGCRPGG